MSLYLRVVAIVVAVVLGALVLPAPNASGSQDAEPTEWIIVLRSDVADVRGQAVALTAGLDRGGHGRVFEHALKGFTAALTETEASEVAASPLVEFVERDIIVSIDTQNTPAGIARVGTLANVALGVGGGASVDVDIAVLDTGIDLDHPDLNVVGGVDCSDRDENGDCVAGGDDDHFHGTHVAGTIAAVDNDFGVVGVAPGARLWAVKVLGSNGKGPLSDVIAGIDWVAENADVIEVANMSLGGLGYSVAQYNAIDQAVASGVAFAVAAGNNSAPAAGVSPAAFDHVLTVSAVADYDGIPGGLGAPTCRPDADDTLAAFSNYGDAVDIAAPGVCVVSTVPTRYGNGYAQLNGTSMASPHVAGALGLLAAHQRATSAADVEALYDTVRSAGTYDWTDTANDGEHEPMLDVRWFSPLDGVLPGPVGMPGSGDVNCDASTSIADALQIAQFVTGLAVPASVCGEAEAGPTFTAAADVNGDELVTIADALLVAQCVAGLDICSM